MINRQRTAPVSYLLYIAATVKRCLALILILVHLVNIAGVYGLFCLSEENTKDVLAKLDEDIYAGSDAITIRVPFSMPYPAAHGNYEKAQGKFTHEGQVYRLVKQKIYNDTLYVVCVKDATGTLIQDALQDWIASMTDRPMETKTNSKFATLMIKDFEEAHSLIVEAAYPSVVGQLYRGYKGIVALLNSIEPPDQPPQLAA